jgi:predicted nucleic acid-binding Zn ribbon protein
MRKVGDLLKEYLRDKGWLESNPYDPLFRQWEKIAGKAVSDHARLIDVRDGILLVEVDHPGWLQMLQLRKEALLKAARAAAPLAALEGIKVRVGQSLPRADH